jgi:hypothetical protein
VAEAQFGRTGGFLTIGEVVNVKDDPTQTGKAKVKWLVGAASQGDISEEDLPWTASMSPSTNPNINGIGTPVTGLMVGSKVYGVPLSGDGQEFMIIGSVPKSGNGEVDSDAQYNSDIPAVAKQQENGGEQQEKFGDKNNVVTEKSIITFAEEEGGDSKQAAKYPKLKDSIGHVDAITEEGGGSTGAMV